jgi:hypothetical protein
VSEDPAAEQAPLTRDYISADHQRVVHLTFPAGLVPPLTITLNDPAVGPTFFYYNPRMP